MTYSFKEQLTAGEKSEQYLDRFFSQWYSITPVGMAEQRQGIDRIFTRADGTTFPIEYKTDWTAGKTGNAFVETVSVDTANKPGWAYSSKARYLIYYVPGDSLIYVIEFSRLRSHLQRWAKQYQTRAIPNQGYRTKGLLVPLMEFEKIAKQVISI